MNMFSALTAATALIITSIDLAIGPMYYNYCNDYECFDFDERYKVCHQLLHSHLFSNCNKMPVWSVHLLKVNP